MPPKKGFVEDPAAPPEVEPVEPRGPVQWHDPQPGQFVALGAEHISTHAGEWKVDPATGLTTEPFTGGE